MVYIDLEAGEGVGRVGCTILIPVEPGSMALHPEGVFLNYRCMSSLKRHTPLLAAFLLFGCVRTPVEESPDASSGGLGVNASDCAPRPSKTKYVVHTVAKGETVQSIAKKYGSTVAWIRSANCITDPTKIAVGRMLLVSETNPPSPSSEGSFVQPFPLKGDKGS